MKKYLWLFAAIIVAFSLAFVVSCGGSSPTTPGTPEEGGGGGGGGGGGDGDVSTVVGGLNADGSAMLVDGALIDWYNEQKDKSPMIIAGTGMVGNHPSSECQDAYQFIIDNKDTGYLEIEFLVTEDDWVGNSAALEAGTSEDWGVIRWTDCLWPKADGNGKWKADFSDCVDDMAMETAGFERITYGVDEFNPIKSITFYKEK